ncbi:MAG: TspO/MBR family protein [Candidatus Micrarchaeota archaeon]
MKVRSIAYLLFFILLSQMAGIIGSFFTFDSIGSWYAYLERPSFAPPNWIFGPVWITLYALMGIAAYIVWEKGWKTQEVKFALGWFGAQLVLNALWSIIFFGLQSPGPAFIEILILWAAIAMTIMSFGRLSRNAAWLLVPYILWVSFAAILNFSIWLLNP